MKTLIKTLLILAVFLIGAYQIKAQTFFVSGRDNNSRGKVIDKVKFEGYQVTQDSASADYIVNMLIDGSYKVVSIHLSYHGYIMITDRETGKEVTRTQIVGANPAALNGYNAAYTIFNKIDRKYLPAALKKCEKKPA